jgi:hypothetical protein
LRATKPVEDAGEAGVVVVVVVVVVGRGAAALTAGKAVNAATNAVTTKPMARRGYVKDFS